MSSESEPDGVWDLVGYVRSSGYRADAVRHLFDAGPSMPSEIAEGADHALPHVSRALAELRSHDVVTLLVPEETRRGRIYGLTEAGETVAEHLLRGIEEFDWTVVDGDGFPFDDLVEFLRSSAASALRSLAYRDGRHVQIVVPPHGPGGSDGPDDDDGSTFEPGPAVTASVGSNGAEAREDARSHRYVVCGFTERTVVQIVLAERERVGIVLDAAFDFELPSLVDRCLERIDGTAPR